MKYIDADRLKAEIEKHIKEVKDAAERFTPNMGFFDAKLSGIYDVMAIIDSLQQEQPDVDIREEIKKLEFIGSNDARDIEAVAKHFYELGLKSK